MLVVQVSYMFWHCTFIAARIYSTQLEVICAKNKKRKAKSGVYSVVGIGPTLVRNCSVHGSKKLQNAYKIYCDDETHA